MSNFAGRHRMGCALWHNFEGKEKAYGNNTNHPHPQRDSRSEAITRLIESVAKQQEALAEILEAEHRKIQKTVELANVDVDDLVEIDESVRRVVDAMTRLEMTLQLKLGMFQDCLCPDFLWNRFLLVRSGLLLTRKAKTATISPKGG